MVQRIEEADILAGMPHHLGGACKSARLAGEAGTEIDDRDLRRGRGIIFDALLLKQIHRGSLGFAAADYKPSTPALPGAVLTGSSFRGCPKGRAWNPFSRGQCSWVPGSPLRGAPE